MRIGIIGLGYVGLPLAVEFAEAGHDVVGLDISEERVQAVAAAQSYIEDVPSERLAAVGGRIFSTTRLPGHHPGAARAPAGEVGPDRGQGLPWGESYVGKPDVEDVVFAFLRFPSGLSAHMHLSWLDPHKERRFTVVGAKRMATFDDMAPDRKLTVYDKGFDQDFRSYGEYIARSGDVWSPQISNEEPLRIECGHFIDCIRDGRPPRSDGASGLRVVRALEMLQRSLEESSRAASV